MEYEDGTEAPSQCTPKLDNGRVFVISTSQFWRKRFLDVFQSYKEYEFQPPDQVSTRRNGTVCTKPQKVQVLKTLSYTTAMISILFRDEFHTEKYNTSPTIKLIEDILKRQLQHKKPGTHNVSIVPISGTPLTNRPGDIAHYLRHMVVPMWSKDKILKKWMAKEAVEIGKRWDTHCVNRKANHNPTTEIIQRFTPLVEKLFIRFTTNSDFLGHSPVKVPVNKFQEVTCIHSDR